MSVKRNPNSNLKDDDTLVRHIYDDHCISVGHKIYMDVLWAMFDSILEEDRLRFGNQHQEFVDDARNESKLGLIELESNERFRERFNAFVTPLVYS
ncbi:hypothetical protein [Pseudoalteromonas sp. NSLLW218]|uniref:hypothetical protein n=1 Tax=Pseudoalteromonas sp. NSLLW218 TaxID=2792048 RepID=UPI0018CC91F5|nr:hypothetical protein [Pseudoalteromonas sp. NSLLW218]MBH0090610.1 hypothetical protein [Pseudoalteromonas sp. NSLLW218]